jgi:hypothetical protein
MEIPAIPLRRRQSGGSDATRRTYKTGRGLDNENDPFIIKIREIIPSLQIAAAFAR